MGASSPTDADLHARLRRQEVITELSQQALAGTDLEGLYRDATAAVTETLATEYCVVLERLPDGTEGVCRAGVGCTAGAVGNATVALNRDSRPAESSPAEEPVVVDDVRADERTNDSALLTDLDIVSGISVPISTADGPWGVLETYATERRAFTEADADFVGRVADVLASAVEAEREHAEREELFDRISDAFFALDEEWRFTHLNERAHELINPDGRELIGTEVWAEFPEAIEQKFKPNYERAMYEQETVSFEEYYPEPIDAWFEVRAYPSATGLSVYFRDVTERRERERALRRTERRFEAIFEDPNILVGLLEPDGTVLDINGTAMEYIDADLAAVSGEPFWETPWWGTSEAIRADVKEWVERAAAGEYVNFEADLSRPDGERYTLNGVFRPVTNDDGDVVSIIVSDRDVTERREFERQLSTLMDNVPGMVYRCRNERGWPMEFVSDACEELTGYDSEALESGDIGWGADVMVQDDRELLWETVQRDASERKPFSETYRIETADGERRWVRDYGRGVFDDEGALVGVEGIIADITERKRLESELEESERRYRTLVEHFPNGAVALVDEDLCYQTVGGTPLEAADTTAAELEGEPLEEVLPPALATELVPRYEAALEGEASAFELSSSGRIYDVQTIPVRDDDGAVFGAIGMSQDITERREYERQLEESERRYRALAQHFPNGAVGVYDRDLTYTLTEGAMLGEVLPPAGRLEGNRMPDVFPDETVADLEPLFRAAVEDGETGSIETAFDGRNWRVWATPLRDGDGDIFAGLSFAQDVTEQVERENDLERYETIVEVVNDGVYVVDEDRRFTMVNETYAEMLGYAPDELVGTDASAVVDDVVAGQVAELEAATAASDVEWPSIEAELRTADGETLPVEGTFAMLPEDDSRWHRVGIVRDISERKARERRLEESERRYRTLVENFPEGAVGLFDEELAYTAVGGQLLDEVGIAREDRVGSSIDELHPDHLADEIEPYFHAALDGEANSFEVERYGRHLYAHTLPVRNGDDEIFAGMVVVQDVTERREYQRKLEESNERLEQFAYAASHDLQEPLRMVTSYLTLLENRYGDAFDEDGREFLAYAVDGADRMREMIDGLLEYSRVETQGAPLEPTDLNAVFENVREDLQIQIEENDAEITVDDLPRVEGDASQLRQVLQNLLSNAITYSGDEPPRVHVGADRRDDEWVISVRDEGIGIDPADQDRVFTIFDRLHSREEYEGTGIGLALSERIVERHGGEIWVDSEPGEGATFSLTLPAARAQE